MIKKLFTLFTLTLFLPHNTTTLFSWGQNGHRIVANISRYYISPKTELALQKITNVSLDQLATLPDDMRSNPNSFLWRYCDIDYSKKKKDILCQSTSVEWEKAHDWHFINTDVIKSYEQMINQKDGNLFIALQNSILILQHSDSSLSEKESALAWLVHLIGDLHQPLHLGHEKDKAGNEIFIPISRTESTDLHTIWDITLIENTQLSYSEFTDFILEKKLDVPIQKNISRESIYDWIIKEVKITNSIYNDIKLPFDLHAYNFKYLPIIKEQLFLAGTRLASLLNSILDPI